MRGIKIYIIGFSGTGKTSVGRALEGLGLSVSYIDKEIADAAGKSISEIFETEGEASFRDRETAVLKAFADDDAPAVADCGGGIIVRQENIEIMKKSGKVVLLDASPETIYDRVKDDSSRPLLKKIKDAGGIADMKQGRESSYKAAADIIINTDRLSAEAAAGEIYKVYESCNRTGQSQI